MGSSEDPARQPDNGLTVVIPAYNEAARIERVLQAVTGTDLPSWILVVDDGSEDQTSEAAQSWAGRDGRVHLLRLAQNQGKGAAMVAGARLSPSDVVLFLDADLVGLQPGHVEALARPVLQGQADMTVGLFHKGRLHTDWAHLLTPFLSGQRCLRWSLFADAPDLEDAGWGVETALHLHAGRQHLRLLKVPLEGVTQVTKEEKDEFPASARNRARMYGHILRYVTTFLAGWLMGYRFVVRMRRRWQERRA
ncbi:MAG: glycosyltransferase family 2 protein [Chloroflexi bacterium]|nr:glycosyltransferase family 2 protein [Chloroflexota bacterium]